MGEPLTCNVYLMTSVPGVIDGARVVMFTQIDSRHRATGNCQQIVNGVISGSAYGLAICSYDGDAGYYLFGCDSNWNAVTDTFHETIEQAQAQAEFEYQGVTATWLKV